MGWPREPLSPAAHPPDTPLRLQRKTYRPITDCSRCMHFRRPFERRRSRIQVLGDCRPSADVKHSLVQSIVAPPLILMLADTGYRRTGVKECVACLVVRLDGSLWI